MTESYSNPMGVSGACSYGDVLDHLLSIPEAEHINLMLAMAVHYDRDPADDALVAHRWGSRSALADVVAAGKRKWRLA